MAERYCLRTFRLLVVALVASMLALPVSAHEGGDIAGGFVSGFLHPLSGLDHVVAMIAVGLWGAVLKRPAIWILPVAFPIVMALGGALAVRGVPVPGVEIGIACSAIVLGLMVTLWVKPALWIATVIVASFAVFHGHAHGTELPEAAAPLAYSGGFVMATGVLHLSGIAIGAMMGRTVIRVVGALVVTVGIYFLSGALG